MGEDNNNNFNRNDEKTNGTNTTNTDDNVVNFKKETDNNNYTRKLFTDNDVRYNQGQATMATTAKTYLILGWISAAFTAFISPFFAIGGIIFGVLANKEVRGSGNAVIITSIVLAAVNFLFGLFLVTLLRRMFIGV